jgi:Tfp pilus assembly protein PilW
MRLACFHNKVAQRGESLIQIIVALGVAGILMGTVISEWVTTTSRAKYLRIRSSLRKEIQQALDLMRFELSLIGSAVPISLPSSSSLGNSAAPIQVDSTAISASFLINLSGSSTRTRTTASGSSSSLSLVDGSIFVSGDYLVLYDDRRENSEVLLAEVTSVSGNSVSLGNISASSGSAEFPAGSYVAVLNPVTYQLGPQSNGIERIEGGNTIAVLTNGSFNLEFLDATGNTLTPPLDLATQTSQLSSIRVSITGRDSSNTREEAGTLR